MRNAVIHHIGTYFGVSVRPSFCSRLTFYWKELRSCNMAQNCLPLPEQIIYLFLKKKMVEKMIGNLKVGLMVIQFSELSELGVEKYV